ncbi:MAG: hypothetical protein HKO76_05640, partial [Acidimicrobiia bacterium]|nr:hypothetical protein [Acidimicrobiia bacterium]
TIPETITVDVNDPALVISQIGTTPSGEFVELYNIGPGPINLNGFELTWDGNPEPLPASTIGQGERFLIVRPGWSGIAPDATISNSGPGLVGSNISIGLRDGAAVVIDTVGFGTGAAEGTSLAPLAPNSAVERKLAGTLGNCQDIDDNQGDFWVVTPNPRNTGSGAVGCLAASPPAVGSKIVVSELSGGSVLGDPSDFFELKNVGTAPTDISGWVFNIDMAGGGLQHFVYTGGPTLLAPGQHFLIVRNNHPGIGGLGPDAVFDPGTAGFPIEIRGVSLEAVGVVVDAFGFDESGYNSAYYEVSALAGVGSNWHYQRVAGECQDSDNNPADFAQLGAADPDNSTVIEPC